MIDRKVGKNIYWSEGWLDGKYVIGLWKLPWDGYNRMYVCDKEPKNKAAILKNLNNWYKSGNTERLK